MLIKFVRDSSKMQQLSWVFWSLPEGPRISTSSGGRCMRPDASFLASSSARPAAALRDLTRPVTAVLTPCSSNTGSLLTLSWPLEFEKSGCWVNVLIILTDGIYQVESYVILIRLARTSRFVSLFLDRCLLFSKTVFSLRLRWRANVWCLCVGPSLVRHRHRSKSMWGDHHLSW